MNEVIEKTQVNPVPVPAPNIIDPTLRSLGQITNVSADVWPYIKQKYLKQTLIIGGILLIAEILWLTYSFSSNNISGATFYVALIPFGLGLWFYTSIKNKVEDAFMEQFAAANGLTFQKYGLPGNLDGSIFSIGHGAAGTDLVTGNSQNLPMCLFNYHYTVGSGKNSHTYYYTILRLEYPTPLPPIFLQVKGHDFGEGIFGYFSANDPEKIKLEGNFNDYFTVWTKKGLETETLEIFTPDFMEKIQDEWKYFSLEFINDHIYIYSYQIITTKAMLDSMYDLAKYLITKVGPLAARMQSSLTDMEQLEQNK